MYERYNTHFKEMKAKYSKLKLVAKEDSKFMQLLFKWTLMKIWCPLFLTNFTTTINYTIYMPKKYIGTRQGYSINTHEEVHLAQFHKWWYLFSATYLLLLPMGITMRAYWEWQAWKVTLATHMQLYGEVSPQLQNSIVQHFAGPTYLYMFPFKKYMRKLVTREVSRLNAERLYAIWQESANQDN
jgi:hypothetical protein